MSISEEVEAEMKKYDEKVRIASWKRFPTPTTMGENIYDLKDM